MAVLVYWLIFAAFAVGALSYASAVSRAVTVPVSGSAATLINRRSVILAAAGVALVLLVGLRYRVGGDWANYLDVFRRMAPQSLSEAMASSGQEPGYIFANWLAVQVGAGIWFVNLFCAIPFAYGLLKLCRQQPNPWLALLVATPFMIVVVAMGYTRQAAALGCLMAGIAERVDGTPLIRLALWVLAGALFHRTVLVFLPIMYTTASKNRFLIYLLVLVSLILAYYTVLPSAFDQYRGGYIRTELSAAGASVRVIMDVIPALLVLVFGRRFFWSPDEAAVWRIYAILCLIAGAALPFIRSSVIIDRLAIYLIPMQIFTYSRIGYAFGLVRRGWLMWTLGVTLYSAAVLFVWLNYAVNASSWLPYRNYLTSPERG